MEKIDYQLLSSLFFFSQQSEILDEFDLSSLCFSETKIRNINHTFQVSRSLSAPFSFDLHQNLFHRSEMEISGNNIFVFPPPTLPSSEI